MSRARFVLGLVISVHASACHPAAAPSLTADRGTCDDAVTFTVTSRREGPVVHVEYQSEHVCPPRATKHLPIASIEQREPGCPVGQEAFVVHGGEVSKREGVGAEASPRAGEALLEASRTGLASSRALVLSCQPGHLAWLFVSTSDPPRLAVYDGELHWDAAHPALVSPRAPHPDPSPPPPHGEQPEVHAINPAPVSDVPCDGSRSPTSYVARVVSAHLLPGPDRVVRYVLDLDASGGARLRIEKKELSTESKQRENLSVNRSLAGTACIAEGHRGVATRRGATSTIKYEAGLTWVCDDVQRGVAGAAARLRELAPVHEDCRRYAWDGQGTGKLKSQKLLRCRAYDSDPTLTPDTIPTQELYLGRLGIESLEPESTCDKATFLRAVDREDAVKATLNVPACDPNKTRDIQCASKR